MMTLPTRGAERLDQCGFFISGIEAMPAAGILDQDEKFVLIDGEIVPMSPPHAPHVRVKAMLVRAWAAQLQNCLLIPEATLVISGRPAITFEVDVLILNGMDVPSSIRPHDVVIAIEIADTMRLRDLMIKAPRYGKAGVVELWVVDIPSAVTVLHRAPSADGWGEIITAPFDLTLAPLFDPGLSVRLSDIAS
jgi:Uma2 family endonuclease